MKLYAVTLLFALMICSVSATVSYAVSDNGQYVYGYYGTAAADTVTLISGTTDPTALCNNADGVSGLNQWLWDYAKITPTAKSIVVKPYSNLRYIDMSTDLISIAGEYSSWFTDKPTDNKMAIKVNNTYLISTSTTGTVYVKLLNAGTYNTMAITKYTNQCLATGTPAQQAKYTCDPNLYYGCGPTLDSDGTGTTYSTENIGAKQCDTLGTGYITPTGKTSYCVCKTPFQGTVVSVNNPNKVAEQTCDASGSPGMQLCAEATTAGADVAWGTCANLCSNGKWDTGEVGADCGGTCTACPTTGTTTTTTVYAPHRGTNWLYHDMYSGCDVNMCQIGETGAQQKGFNCGFEGLIEGVCAYSCIDVVCCNAGSVVTRNAVVGSCDIGLLDCHRSASSDDGECTGCASGYTLATTPAGAYTCCSGTGTVTGSLTVSGVLTSYCCTTGNVPLQATAGGAATYCVPYDGTAKLCPTGYTYDTTNKACKLP